MHVCTHMHMHTQMYITHMHTLNAHTIHMFLVEINSLHLLYTDS